MENMQKKRNEGKTVNKEAFRMLALEIGLNAACRKLGVPINTGKSWARRGGWELPKRPGGRPQRNLEATSLHPVADALVASHKELEGATKTGLMITAAKAATKAAQKPPLDVSSTSQFRDLANSSNRIFGWNTKASPQAQFNQVVITQEQLREIGMLRESVREEKETPENVKKRIERLRTPEGQEELRRTASERLGRAQTTEQPKLPPTPSATEIYEVTIRGDGGGVKVRR